MASLWPFKSSRDNSDIPIASLEVVGPKTDKMATEGAVIPFKEPEPEVKQAILPLPNIQPGDKILIHATVVEVNLAKGEAMVSIPAQGHVTSGIAKVWVNGDVIDKITIPDFKVGDPVMKDSGLHKGTILGIHGSDCWVRFELEDGTFTYETVTQYILRRTP